MEKKFTLMKTLSAFFNLLCGKKNACAVNNDATGGSVDCPLTRVNNQSNNMDDPDKSGSFLFYNQSAIDDQTAAVNDSSSIAGDQKLKNNDAHSHSKHSENDELASGNGPASVYDRARWRVNDDLAACSAINSEWPVVNGYYPGVSSEWQLWNKNILACNRQTTNTEPKNTRTNQNDAWLPFASFSFIRHSLGVGGSTIISAVVKLFEEDDFKKSLRPVFIPVAQTRIKRSNYKTD
jgi:hypothetical protein